jgi:subtilisin family serine protease
VPDLIAPGVNVASSIPGGGMAADDGTSMATPHVAGLAALLMQARPQATIAQVEGAILRSCRRPAGVPQDRGNHGVPDALIALSHLPGTSPVLVNKPAKAGKPKKVKRPRKVKAGQSNARGKRRR